MKRLLGFILLLGLVAGGGAALYLREELRTPYPESPAGIIEIPRGLRARDIAKLLEDRRVIRSRYVALAYILYAGNRNKLQAGEYQLDRPMTAPEVIQKIVTGTVLLHKFTVPEGLTVRETAQKWEEQKFGTTEEFLAAANDAMDSLRRFEPTATSLEGYLFPETYSFPARTTAREAVEAMIVGLQRAIENLKKVVPQSDWPLNLRETVILASLVETEAAHDDERGLVASVYVNRLQRKIFLQCDPTVIYALELANQYRGRLTRDDLQFSSPYNTYVNSGLPPGPIANPGYESLVAAVQPASTKLLFFVRTVEGRHTFSETLAAHNRAVAAYRRLRNGG